MKPLSSLLPLLVFTSSAAAWTRVDHWQTKVMTTTSKKLYTSSIPVYPTVSDPPKPVSSNVSTTSYSTDAGGPFMLQSIHTYVVTVTDLFYADDAADAFCVSTGQFTPCTPTPTYTGPPGAVTSVVTNYWHPLVVANPDSCTLTSYAYTTAGEVNPQYLSRSVPDIEEQATGSDMCLTVSTWVSTKSTNLGGQAVTTTVVDVYLKDDTVENVSPGYELSAMSQCVDPRQHSCSIITALTPTEPCETAGQTYPPTVNAGETGANAGGGGAAPTGTGTAAGPSESKPGAAGVLGIKAGILLALPVVAVVFVL
ncbi:hypothetical protein B0H66DRAFT_630287 [Apodospora peruviana]|uniref:Uncharacterized protein n=1 Tax=Apodospora peruviana TaxID=516989 RepID=A0AAE0HXU8_9PEZI|nr:hypothetical protein B0H66DRAFT_630287 [Apodospora peruviana]